MTFPNSQGWNNRRAKLTEKHIPWIRKCVANGVPKESLAAMLGVHLSTINKALRNHLGSNWAKVKMAETAKR